MSLSNPDTAVTEQRLSEFYQGILPYLGGMPEMVANKFSRGDIYSTDEKMIGQWIDGKPLYQQIITGVCPTTSENGTYINGNIGNVINNIDSIVELSGTIKSSGGNTLQLPWTTSAGNRVTLGFSNSANKIIIANGAVGYSNMPIIATIKYTKTTDSAISIGTDTDYSTTEKIVGTWIDGKPIWQKTYNLGDLPNNSAKNVPIDNFSSIGEIIDIRCFAKTKSGVGGFSLPKVNADINFYINTSGYFSIVTTSDYSSNSAYATLQYTKTS